MPPSSIDGTETVPRAPRVVRLSRRHIRAVAVIALLCVVAEVFVRWIEVQLPPNSFGDGEELALKLEQMEALAIAGEAPEVVFVGGSGVDAGIDPFTFDDVSTRFANTYNGAGVAMPVEFIAPWVRRFVVERVQPRLVVVGVYPFQLGDFSTQVGGSENVEAYSAAYGATLDRLDPGPLAQFEVAVADHSALVDSRHHLRSPYQVARATWGRLTGSDPPWALAKDPNRRTKEDWEEIVSPRGTNWSYAAVPAEPLVDSAMAARYTAWIESGPDISKVSEMLDDILDLGLEVVLFTPPVDRATLGRSGLDFTALDAATELMGTVADERGVPFINLFVEDFDPYDFHDKIHLDHRGARSLSTTLAIRVDALCVEGRIASCAGPP